MIEKILVPIDGSEPANRALDFALDLAQKYSAEILILSVLQFDAFPPDVKGVIYESLETFHKKVLSDALEKARKVSINLNISTRLEQGYPADKIIETVQEGNFDIIVMGRRGQGHLRHTLLGSVSDRVADQAPCGLFIIK